MSYTEVKGDLFSSSCSLCHCVSQDLKMGKGIATMFKKKFAGLHDLKLQKLQVGDVGILERGSRYIFYLVTKPIFYNKPTYDTLRQSLASLRREIEKITEEEFSVAMPKIGCGLDGLEWEEVREIIKEELCSVHVTVYEGKS